MSSKSSYAQRKIYDPLDEISGTVRLVGEHLPESVVAGDKLGSASRGWVARVDEAKNLDRGYVAHPRSLQSRSSGEKDDVSERNRLTKSCTCVTTLSINNSTSLL